MRERNVRRKIQIRAPALMADKPTLRILTDTPVHPRPDRLTNARRSLASMLATRCLVVAQAQAMRDRIAVAARDRTRVGGCTLRAYPPTLRSPLLDGGGAPPIGVSDTHGTNPLAAHRLAELTYVSLDAD